jgi:hypothetical protein
MPSLFGTTVAANYGRMTAQETYGVGQQFSNFGTRQVRFVKVVISGGSNNDLTKGSDGATGSYSDSLSLFALAIRGIQQYAEIYYVGTPVATGFVIAVSDDTDNDNDAANGNISNGGNGLIEAAVNAAIASGTATATTISNLAPGVTI